MSLLRVGVATGMSLLRRGLASELRSAYDEGRRRRGAWTEISEPSIELTYFEIAALGLALGLKMPQI